MKKKVFLFTYALARGGSEKVVSILLQELQHEFDLHLVLTSNYIEFPIPEKIPVFIIDNGKETDNNLIRLINLPMLAFKYYRLCKKHNVDISLSFLNRPNYIACMIKYFGWKKSVLISERTSTLMQYRKNDLKSGIGKFLVKWLYPKADLILPNSKENASDLKNIFGINSPVHTIYNAINLNDILRKKNEQILDVNFTKFTYIMIGRFIDEKDHLTLIEAFSLLPIRNNCQLLIIGHGKNEDKIRSKIESLKLSSNITLLHFVDNPYKYLSRANCLVFSSFQEGLPNVLIEALACSLPAISTDCKTGPRELLAPNTDYNYKITNDIELAEYGILVPVKNASLLSKAMLMVYENKSLRDQYAEKGCERASQFDVSVISNEYKNILAKY